MPLWTEGLQTNKIFRGILLGSLFQLLLLVLAALWYLLHPSALGPESDRWVTGSALLVLAVIALAQIAASLYLTRRYALLSQTIGQVEALNRALSEQRHDFMNHLQVMQTLLEMREGDEALIYLNKVTGYMRGLQGVLRTQSPAVNALLQAKLNDCDGHGVQMAMQVQARLSKPPMEPWLICRLLGNLIDNAIEAAAALPEGERQIELTMREDIDGLFIQMRNRSEISQEQVARFFTPGFTTKGSGRGEGLGIVKSLVQARGGQVGAHLDAGWVVLECRIPARHSERIDRLEARIDRF